LGKKKRRYKKRIPSFDKETPLISANTQPGAKKIATYVLNPSPLE
jgi:hypothetical protein